LVSTIKTDVLIVGGGLQGLLVLDQLSAAGRSCVLVTDSDLGSGQTLHSHGLLNTGFGFAGPRLRETRDRLVLPHLRARGIQPYGDWFLLTPDDVEVGERASSSILPRGMDPGAARIRRLPELNFPKRTLVEALGRDHLDRILRATAIHMSGTGAIETVEVRPHGSDRKLLFAPSVVVAATGTGTKTFLGPLAGASTQLAKIRYRRVHMLCVRGPVGVLPATSVLSSTHDLNVVAHANGGTVTWYSTPFQADDPNFEDAPGDARAALDPEVVRDGFRRLESLFPAIATTDELRFASYAGYRQDIGETPGTPACELVDGTANLVMALPSLVVNAWTNAEAAVEIVNAVTPRRTSQPDLPGAGAGVRVGPLREDEPDVHWGTWRQMFDRLTRL
jgi:glycine/D-amino acid oxidase-like deaminating enzyme